MESNNNYFPKDFVPGPNDFLTKRGKKCNNYIRNVKVNDVVALKLDEYSLAKTKQDKSSISTAVMAETRDNNCNGGFLKNHPDTVLWFQVGDCLAREKTSRAFCDALEDSEKTSQAFRDALEGHYRSSNSFKKKRRRMIDDESKQQKNDIIMHSQEQIKSIDFFADEFDALNYYSSTGANEDQIYDASLFASNSYKKEMDCFEPLPFYFDQMSSVADEIDFNNFDKDIDLELEEDCDDLMSTFSSLCSEDDIDYNFEQELSDITQFESTLNLVDNIFSNSCGIVSKHCDKKIESNYTFGGFTQMPSCRTSVAKSA